MPGSIKMHSYLIFIDFYNSINGYVIFSIYRKFYNQPDI